MLAICAHLHFQLSRKSLPMELEPKSTNKQHTNRLSSDWSTFRRILHDENRLSHGCKIAPTVMQLACIWPASRLTRRDSFEFACKFAADVLFAASHVSRLPVASNSFAISSSSSRRRAEL